MFQSDETFMIYTPLYSDEKTVENSAEIGENTSISPCSVQEEPNENEESDNEPPEVQPIIKCKR